ncbi:unnamed protein product [Heterobilharzia americana]|nr:unnamed protein product [Heterobilharzia americana]
MSTSRIVYSRAFLKSLQPIASQVDRKSKKKHHDGWQRGLKRVTIDQITIPEILSTNCRSLPNKVHYLQSLLSTNVYRNTGVIMLQETWLHSLYDDDLVCLDGFKLF